MALRLRPRWPRIGRNCLKAGPGWRGSARAPTPPGPERPRCAAPALPPDTPRRSPPHGGRSQSGWSRRWRCKHCTPWRKTARCGADDCSVSRPARPCCCPAGRPAPLKSQTDHHTLVTEQRRGHVTIIDRPHPFYGHTLPVVRHTSSRGTPCRVVPLPNGRTRSVPKAATDRVSLPASPGPARPLGPPHPGRDEDAAALPMCAAASRLRPISAPTLLAVARRLQAMGRLQEEACHDSSSCPTAHGPTGQASPRPAPAPVHSGATTHTRSTPAPAVRATPGHPHATPTRRDHRRTQGGPRQGILMLGLLRRALRRSAPHAPRSLSGTRRCGRCSAMASARTGPTTSSSGPSSSGGLRLVCR